MSADLNHQAIFLDIDGVLNSTDSTFTKIGRTHRTDLQVQAERDLLDHLGLASIEELVYGVKFALNTVNPMSVAMLNRLIGSCKNPCLVLSSTHRKHYSRQYSYGSTAHKTVLAHYLSAMGVRVPDAFLVTPCLYTERGAEVNAVLEQLGEKIQSYVILDDGADFFRDQNFVWCDPRYGFTFADYAQACKFLQTEEPSCILM